MCVLIVEDDNADARLVSALVEEPDCPPRSSW